ncbi:FAD:protein FMN transferase [Sulfuricaulis sp.]|jgi:thiamine biosynthesis lipoprotein|uniref:FAD:protein FMN transferase n=1 Tax=Sulfuricaulis sp. TaxID=2003553 RepID=UPI00355A0519
MPYPKRLLSVFVIVFPVFVTVLIRPGDVSAELPQYADTRPLMGTLVSMTVEGPRRDVLEQGVNDAYREMSRLSDMMNHYNPDSVVSQINRQAGVQPVTVPRELMEVLAMARRVSERSEGAFDITVGSLNVWRFNPENPGMPSPDEIRHALPLVNFRHVILNEKNRTVLLKQYGMRMDLGGIAKLYILDAGMQVLKQRGITHAMINGGGDVVVMGIHQGRPWRIGIRHPRRGDVLLGTVELTQGWVVTSGDYERYFFRDGKRYHHILDPRTGYPTEGPQQVTLVANDIGRVNGYSLAIMVRGVEWGRALIVQTPGLSGLVVDHAGQLWSSPGMEKLWFAAPTPQGH